MPGVSAEDIGAFVRRDWAALAEAKTESLVQHHVHARGRQLGTLVDHSRQLGCVHGEDRRARFCDDGAWRLFAPRVRRGARHVTAAPCHDDAGAGTAIDADREVAVKGDVEVRHWCRAGNQHLVEFERAYGADAREPLELAQRDRTDGPMRLEVLEQGA
jgi:hypothetical protein